MTEDEARRAVEFVFDFASPNAYLAWKVLPRLLQGSGARMVLKPALLGGIFKATGNQAPMLTYAGVPAKLAYQQRDMARFIARHDLAAFRMNPHFPVNSLLLMRGLCAAEAMGQAEPYVAAGLAAMWEGGEKMDEPEAFARVFDAAGLDGALLLRRTADPEVKEALADHTRQAVARGVFGIPTFFVGGEMFFGKERLEEVARLARG